MSLTYILPGIVIISWVSLQVSTLKARYISTVDFHSSSIFYTNILALSLGLALESVFQRVWQEKHIPEWTTKHIEKKNCEPTLQDNCQSDNSKDRKDDKLQLDKSNDERRREIKQCINIIQGVPLFASLNKSQVTKMAENLKLETFSAGEYIMVQGEKGDKFYILLEGVAVVEIINKGSYTVVATLVKGDFFGEQALITWSSRRKTSVRAKYHSKCLYLDRATFVDIFQGSEVLFIRRWVKRKTICEKLGAFPIDKSHVSAKSDEKIKWIVKCIGKTPLFENHSEEQKVVVAEHMILKKFAKDKVLIKQGEHGNLVYVIEEGTFIVTINDKQVATLKKGTCFGEIAVIYNTPRNATVKTASPGKVWCLHRLTIRKVLTRFNQNETQKIIGFLKKVSLFTPLLNSEFLILQQALITSHFEKDQVIFEQGNWGDKFYIVKTGLVVGTKQFGDDLITFKFGPGDFFGERALLKEEPRTATITCATSVTLLELSRDDFKQILGPIEDNISEHIKQYEYIARRRQSLLTPSPTKQNKGKPSVTYPDLVDLKTIGMLGQGAFGVVTLVVDEERKKGYALKTISKMKVVRDKQVSQIVCEKKVMETLDSPFVVDLKTTYKDETSIYFLLEVCLGGELFSLLKKNTCVDENQARFYIACVIEGFTHIHKQNIVYRDLKPENLVLDDRGYLKITDFGLSKPLDGITYTFCGTPDYLAPEIITMQGHGLAVDWWTLGVLIYEMVLSYSPFQADEMPLIVENIMECDVKFPKLISPECKDIIDRLLQLRPTNRLGVIKGGSQLLREQPWFNGFEWDLLVKRQMEAPVQPRVQSFDDLGNFDDVDGEDDEDSDDEEFDISGENMDWTEVF